MKMLLVVYHFFFIADKYSAKLRIAAGLVLHACIT